MNIDRDQLIQKMRNEQVVVINVLSKANYKKMHITGSESHPLTEDPADFSKEVAGKYGNKKSFVVYGDRFGLLDSYMAVRALEERGLEVLNYAGGLREWHRAGLPVEGTDAGKGAEVTA